MKFQTNGGQVYLAKTSREVNEINLKNKNKTWSQGCNAFIMKEMDIKDDTLYTN